MTETISTPMKLSGELLQASPSRREFRARLVRAGKLRRADGTFANVELPATAIQDAVDHQMFNGLAVFVDHPGFFDSPSIKALVGVTAGAHWNEATQSADATLRFYAPGARDDADPRLASIVADTLAMMLEDQEAGDPVPDVGLSIVFWPRWKPRDNRSDPLVLDEFRKIDSADIVFGPAADGRILQALSSAALSSAALSSYPTPVGHALQGGSPMSDIIKTEEERTDSLTSQENSAAAAPQATPVAPQPPSLEPPGAHAGELALSWMDAARSAAVPLMLAGSGLPQLAQDRLAARSWKSPEELQAAIEAERNYLAGLAEAAVVQLPGSHPRGAGRQVTMRTGMDDMENAVNWLFGVDDAQLPDPQLRKADILYTTLTGDYEFRGIFQADRVMLQGATTITLPDLAVNAMNKVILVQFSNLAHWRWYERIVAVTPNDGSLQPMQWITFGGISNLPQVAEKGPYTELTVDDVRENDSFIKYGGYVGITREMIKNSDIQRIQAVPRALAIAAVRTRSNTISTIFTTASGVGPTLDQDSTALFHANHSNVATTALGTDNTAWRTARNECFQHTEVNSGKVLAVFPKYLLVPAELYDQALVNLGYGEGMPTTYTPEAQDRGFADPRPVPIVVPDWTDATDWAYIVDPMVYPVIHISYSQNPGGRNHPPPELFTVVSETAGLMFTNDTLPIKVRDEFAAGVNGPRGIGKRNVAG